MNDTLELLHELKFSITVRGDIYLCHYLCNILPTVSIYSITYPLFYNLPWKGQWNDLLVVHVGVRLLLVIYTGSSLRVLRCLY